MKTIRNVLIFLLCTQLSGCFVFFIPLPKRAPTPETKTQPNEIPAPRMVQ